MIWIEMARDPVHGGGEWGLFKSLWSPKFKRAERSGSSESEETWAFWETLSSVKSGDQILHLTGIGKDAAFSGVSIAATDGFETKNRPPLAGDWSYSSVFRRVSLRDFVAFKSPINLQSIFRERDAELREYFLENRQRGPEDKKKLFYVIQSGRIQCLNGAYLSEVDEKLASILLDASILNISFPESSAGAEVRNIQTLEVLRRLKGRIGQSSFSQAVRENFSSVCCFPECEVNDDAFLVAGHIARWADNTEKRGNISNGICLCLNHDRAFERGYFAVSADLKIVVNRVFLLKSSWAVKLLDAFEGRPIRSGKISPDIESLAEHRERVGLV